MSAHSNPSNGDVTLMPERAIEVSPGELADCRLIPGCPGELGLPIEAFLRLYAVRDQRILGQITGPEDLTAFITAVRSAEHALGFVQLFTDPATVHLFPGQRLTIDVSLASDDGVAEPGALSPRRWRESGATAPRVEADSDGFRITRTVVSADAVGARRQLLRRVERVSSQGGYRHVGDTVIAELAPDEIRMPFAE